MNKLKNDLTDTMTLYKICDYLIDDSDEIICNICANYREFDEVPDDVEPCPYKRKSGKRACRMGIIKHFKERK